MLFMMLLETSQEVSILATYTHCFRHFPVLVPCPLYREKFYPLQEREATRSICILMVIRKQVPIYFEIHGQEVKISCFCELLNTAFFDLL